MKTKSFSRLSGFLLLNAALLFWGGCATPHMRSFNDNFNQNLPTAPKYSIEDLGETHFTVTVQQGVSLASQERIIYVKRAASTVVEQEARRRGWRNWQLDYVVDRDQGWMRLVKADVIRKNPVEFQVGQPGNNP
jgi:hypothetical protein